MNKRSTREIIGFDDRLGMVIGIILVSLSMGLIFSGLKFWEEPMKFFRVSLFISMMHTTVYWLVFRQLLIFFRRRLPSYKDAGKRIALQFLSVIVLYVFLNPSLEVLSHKICFPYEEMHDLPVISMTTATFIVVALVMALYEGVYFYEKLKASIAEREQLERKNIESQLEGLKNQVNPHFLFNSLNTLMYIIPEDANRGVRFVQKLSKVYRYILEIRDKKLISLSEELEFLHAYVFLLKERFEENLQISINTPEEFLEDKIVPLSLQILIENAIKHNIISTEKPLSIDLRIENGNKLIVSNKLQKKNQVMNSTKLGLENIKSRYSFYSSEPVEVIVTQESFVVILPLIKSKNLALA